VRIARLAKHLAKCVGAALRARHGLVMRKSSQLTMRRLLDLQPSLAPLLPLLLCPPPHRPRPRQPKLRVPGSPLLRSPLLLPPRDSLPPRRIRRRPVAQGVELVRDVPQRAKHVDLGLPQPAPLEI